MKNLSNLLLLHHVALSETISSKKKALEYLSQLVAEDVDLQPGDIFDSLIAREKLGSTGVGQGVAIPHGRINGLEQVVCAFLGVKQALAFDAIDGLPVDLFFMLLVPEEATEEHLQLLSIIAEKFSEKEFRNKLRLSTNENEVYQLLIG